MNTDASAMAIGRTGRRQMVFLRNHLWTNQFLPPDAVEWIERGGFVSLWEMRKGSDRGDFVVLRCQWATAGFARRALSITWHLHSWPGSPSTTKIVITVCQPAARGPRIGARGIRDLNSLPAQPLANLGEALAVAKPALDATLTCSSLHQFALSTTVAASQTRDPLREFAAPANTVA
jgi:hypothetical protein